MGLIQWQTLQNIAAHWNSAIVRLSADSCSFLLACSSVMQYRNLWEQDDGTPVTDSQWDEIEALTAKAYTELMSDVGVGTIFPSVLASTPTGALPCDGGTYLRVDWPILYAVLDSAFIVDSDHFITPDLRGRTILGVGAGSGLSTYAMNDAGGQEDHALTTPELASHTHVVTDPGHVHTLSDPGHSHSITDPGHGHSLNNPTHTHSLSDPGHVHAVTDPGHTHTVKGSTNIGVLSGGGTNVASSVTTQSGSQTTGLSVDSHSTGASVNAAAANQSANNANTGITGTNAANTGATVSTHSTGVTNQNAGSGNAHENRQPYRALRYCIWAI